MSPSINTSTLLLAATCFLATASALSLAPAKISCHITPDCSGKPISESAYYPGAQGHCVDVSQCKGLAFHLEGNWNGAEAFCDDACPAHGDNPKQTVSIASGCMANKAQVKSAQLFMLAEGQKPDLNGPLGFQCPLWVL